MRITGLISVFFLLMTHAAVSPFESAVYFDNRTPANRMLFAHWSASGVKFPLPASDAVFLRRVALTAAGRLPTVPEVKAFLADKSPGRYAAVVEKFLHDPGFGSMQAMRFADMLRIKSEFPVNLWPNAVQLWHRTLRDELAKDRPLNEMFREMLTASGSNFRVAHANFFRSAADRSPRGLAAMTLLTVTGMRLEKFPPEKISGIVQLFSKIRYKSTYEWKEEIVYTDYMPAEVKGFFPDGTPFSARLPEQDPRQLFADWLARDGDEYFCRAMTNRVWHWVFGRGIFPVADDLPVELDGKGKNVPFSVEFQDFLNAEFRRGNYSLRHLYRVIMNSAAFRASSLAAEPERLKNFAAYPVRRLEAEVLIDAIAGLTGGYDSYMSVIPEPFTYLPKRSRAVDIADGSISSGVLDSFGRPSRDSGVLSERNTASTDSQSLYLMNSTALYNRTAGYCQRLRRRFRHDAACFERIYLEFLGRYPTAAEKEAFNKYRDALPRNKKQFVLQDTVWVILNSAEFLYHH